MSCGYLLSVRLSVRGGGRQRYGSGFALSRSSASSRCTCKTTDRRVRGPAVSLASGALLLDRGADVAQDRTHLATQEDEGNDRDDGDEGEDQRVLRETLAVFVAMEVGDDCLELVHQTCLLDVEGMIPDASIGRSGSAPA